jgi:hypothetical protein
LSIAFQKRKSNRLTQTNKKHPKWVLTVIKRKIKVIEEKKKPQSLMSELLSQNNSDI